MLFASLAFASPLGAPLAADARPEQDWPFGVEGTCAWVGQALHCTREDRVIVTHERIEGPIEGPVEWRRTAGLEWRSGHREQLAADHVRWASASGGWESRGEVPAFVERGDAATLEARLGTCAVFVEEMPVEVLYDDQGTARLVRLQGFPSTDAGDLDCLAWALGSTPFAGQERVELTVTTSPPPPGDASPGTSRSPSGP